MSVRTFMQAYKLGTEQNPLQAHERTWQGKAAFQVGISAAQHGAIRLNGLRSFARGTGQGTQALRWLIRLARANNVALMGVCSPCGDRRPRLEYRQLKAWYVRNGFTVNGAGQMWLLPCMKIRKVQASRMSSTDESVQLNRSGTASSYLHRG